MSLKIEIPNSTARPKYLSNNITPNFKIGQLEENSSKINLAEANSETTSISSSDLNKGYKKYIGFALTLLSGLLYSLAALIAKLLNDYHPFLISVWRFQGVLFPCVIVILFKIYVQKKYVFDSIWPLKDEQKARTFYILMLRGIFGCWGVVLQFYSLQYLDVADSMVITSSTSVFVAVLAHCFIGEKCTIFPILTAILTIGGVFVISRPPVLTGKSHFDADILIGIAMAIGCMIISAAVLVIQRHLRDVHYSVISLSSGVWGTIQCLILAVAMDVLKFPGTLQHVMYAVALAALTYAAQAAIVIALKLELAGPVAIFQSCDLIFAFGWQFIFLSVTPDFYSLIGSSIIVSGVLLTALRKYIGNLPSDHKYRKRCKFFLL